MTEKYHMIDYIHEGGEALQRTLEDNEETVQSIVTRVSRDGIERVIIAGIGSSHTAAMMAAPLFRYHSRLATHVIPATEVGHYASRLVDQKTLIVVVSRSGERSWVVNALRDAVAREALGVAMTGVGDSLLAQSGEMVLLTSEGPEITFPKTKSVIACAGLLMRLALALAAPDDREASQRLTALRAMPQVIQRCVAQSELEIRALIPAIKDHEVVMIGGTGSNYGVALEAAVKIQEAAYVTCLSDDTGNLLHGSLGPLSARWLVIPLVSTYDLQLSKEFLKLVGQLGAHRLSIVESGLDLEGETDYLLTLPERVDSLLAALAFLPPIQLLTYYWTLANGRNPDSPDVMNILLKAFLPPGREEPDTQRMRGS
jgi:glucosamine 6-phosphate synthetase-like amidotransferase/phosphosugar isomerase protein